MSYILTPNGRKPMITESVESVEENFTLYAERGDTGKKKSMGTYVSLAAAKQHVDKLENSDKWPEGFEAIAVDMKSKKRYMYTDKWELDA